MRRTISLSRVASTLLLLLLYPLSLVEFHPATAYAATTTFSNTGLIQITGPTCPCAAGPASPYPSNINVSGVSGVVSKVTVTLNGISHTGPDNIDVLLVGPAGQNVVIMSDAGGFTQLVGSTLTFDDAAATSLPDNGAIPTGTYKPTDYLAGDVFPAPAPALSAATTLATFNGTNPNGTWSLYVVDDGAGDAGSIAGGWSLTITADVLSATTTTVVSSLNPSFTTAPNDSVTFTATVRKASDNAAVTTGTVTFKEGATILQGPTAPNGSGQVAFTTASLTEGSHVIIAEYSGDATFGPSSGGVTQVVDNHTVVNGSTYCNTGALAIPSSGSAVPYPSRIFVSGFGGNIGKLTAGLKGVSHALPDDVDVLLVGPTGKRLILMSDAGSTNVISGVDLTFDDLAADSLPDNLLITAGTYKPTNHLAGDSFPAPAPAPSADTTLATFNGTDPNGTWSLYVVDDKGGDTGSIGNGWCLNIASVDTVPPDTTITANPPDPSNSSSASISFTGTDNVTPAASLTFECKLDGSAFAGCTSPQSYNSLVEGSHTFQVRAVDAPGNVDLTPASFTWTIDLTPPSVTINQAAGQADPTSASPVAFTVVFTEPVTGFATGDVSLSGTAGATTAVVAEVAPINGTTYTVNVSGMTADGTVIASIQAGVVTDAAGNGNGASTSTDNTVTFIVNGPPTAVADSFSTNEDTPLTVAALGVLGNDVDPNAGDTLTAVLVSSPSNAASFTLNANGSFSYTPVANYYGPDSFTYKARDNHNNDSATVTVSLTVHAVNDAPSVSGPSVTVDEDWGPYSNVWPTTVSPGPSNEAGQTVALILVQSTNMALFSSPPTMTAAGVLSFTPAPNANGTSTVTVVALDTGGTANGGQNTSEPFSFLITVTPVNDPPSVMVVVGGSCGVSPSTGSVIGTMNLALAGGDYAVGGLTVGGSSSNTRLVPNANIVFGGSDASRTVTVTAVPQRNRETAVITVTASNGTQAGTGSVTIAVTVGTSRKDTINGTSGADMIFGLNGDDTINAGGGNDLVCGGNGASTINGGDGDDTIDGGTGNDIVSGGNGNDILIGGPGNDVLAGGPGNDSLTGASGADSFSGGVGTDTATDFAPSQGDTQDGTIP